MGATFILELLLKTKWGEGQNGASNVVVGGWRNTALLGGQDRDRVCIAESPIKLFVAVKVAERPTVKVAERPTAAGQQHPNTLQRTVVLGFPVSQAVGLFACIPVAWPLAQQNN